MNLLLADSMHWDWLGNNIQRVLDLTLNHLYQGIIPVLVGTALSIPVARYASRRRAREDGAKTYRSGAHALVHGFGLLYTIPSIALFVLMPLILGTSIISPVNVLVALTIYTMALMVRSGVDAFNVATVANIAMVSVGAVIGVSSLGTLFTDGLARSIPAELITGVVLSAALAYLADALLALTARRLTAWRTA